MATISAASNFPLFIFSIFLPCSSSLRCVVVQTAKSFVSQYLIFSHSHQINTNIHIIMSSEPKSKEYFKSFAQDFENADQDWESIAPNAHIKYSFAGFPVIEGDEETAHAGFKATLKRFRPKFTYVAGTDTDYIYEVAAYFETIKGEGATDTCHTFLNLTTKERLSKR